MPMERCSLEKFVSQREKPVFIGLPYFKAIRLNARLRNSGHKVNDLVNLAQNQITRTSLVRGKLHEIPSVTCTALIRWNVF